MAAFSQGQRWLVDSEPELGLGMVQSTDKRSVTLYFPDSDTERQYALRDAPLTRFVLEAGDELEHRDQGVMEIKQTHELNGLVIYETTSEQMVPETELADAVKRNNPVMRLLTGQTDHPNWFNFRSALNQGVQTIWNEHLNGLLGTRSTLLPHQLYVAAKATEHSHVRALLADEVGLGKTIEAGLIMNRLVHQGRAKRILIAVPEALQAQWLVEMVRRFSIQCELYQSLEHDFAVGQVHLITHRQLQSSAQLKRIAAEDWDMLVVDEAHHLSTQHEPEALHWSQLAHQLPHLLLLTATPEQLGLESHFGRLQLLDEGRFADFDQYRQDEAIFAELTPLASALNEGAVADETVAELGRLGIDWHGDPQTALNAVLDRHGTGRVVYRNTRKGVAGFHSRRAEKQLFVDQAAREKALAEWLKSQQGEKVLLITHLQEDAKALAHSLWHQFGIEATAFHEGLDLIERDRAAAHFADSEDGAQILVCSEIGGEGRNFQFCHHLVLWDIPAHPDMLEQRIGRLDRIGQTQTIELHAFLAEGSADADRFDWYHDILGCLENIQPAAGAIHEKYVEQWLEAPSPALRETIIKALTELSEQLEHGRDVLLELNSCRQPEATELKERVANLEANHPLMVVDMAANLLNLHFESVTHDIYELIPSSNMLIPTLPGIPEGGCVVTFDRAVAAAREDALFLSWEHPFIQGLADILNSTELGQASIALLETEQVPAGQLLMEVQWSVKWQERYTHALRPHIDNAIFRTLILEGGDKDLSDVLVEQSLQAQVRSLPVKVARKMIRQAKERIMPLYENSQKLASARFAAIQSSAEQSLVKTNRARVERVQYLEKINPLVTPVDVAAMQDLIELELDAIRQCEYVTAGVRLILCAPPGTV